MPNPWLKNVQLLAEFFFDGIQGGSRFWGALSLLSGWTCGIGSLLLDHLAYVGRECGKSHQNGFHVCRGQFKVHSQRKEIDRFLGVRAE